MTEHDQMLKTAQEMSRRRLLGTAAAIGMAAGTSGHAVAQAHPRVDIITVPAMVGPALKPIVDAEANIDVVNGPYQSSVDSISRLTAPGPGPQFDVMVSSYDFSLPIILGPHAGAERVPALDMSLLPNFSRLTPASKTKTATRDGKYFMMPLNWGFDTVLYNKDHVPENDPYTQSWGCIFEDRYAGRIGWWDTSLNMLLAAGLYLGHAEPEKMSRADLTEVGKFMISKKKNVRTLFATFAEGTNLLATGEIWCCYGIVPMRREMELRGFNVAGAWVKEGVLSLVNCCYIPKSAPNRAGGHALINAMWGERYSEALTKACGYLPAAEVSVTNYTPDERKHLGFGLFDGTVKQYPQKFPPDMTHWIETWSRVKSA